MILHPPLVLIWVIGVLKGFHRDFSTILWKSLQNASKTPLGFETFGHCVEIMPLRFWVCVQYAKTYGASKGKLKIMILHPPFGSHLGHRRFEGIS